MRSINGMLKRRGGRPASAILPPLAIVSTSPVDDATGVSPNAAIEITFNRAISFGPDGFLLLRVYNDPPPVTTAENFDTGLEVGNQGGTISIDGAVLTITPGNPMINGTGEYALRISNNAIQDAFGNFFAGIFTDTTLSWTVDAAAPVIVSTTPADDAEGVAVDAAIAITYNEDVTLGATEAFYLRANDSGFSTIETFTGGVGDNGGTAVAVGATVTITPGANMAALEHSIQADEGAVVDAAGNPAAAIADDTTLSFLVAGAVDADPPVVQTLSPTNGATGVSVLSAPFAIFNEDIQFGTAGLEIYLRADTAGFATIETFTTPASGDVAAGDNSGVAVIDGNRLTVTPGADFDFSTPHSIQIQAGAIEDLAGNDFAGIANDTTWAWTTAAESATLDTTAGASPPDYGGDGDFDWYVRAAAGDNDNDGDTYAGAWATLAKMFIELRLQPGVHTVGVEGFTQEEINLANTYSFGALYSKIKIYAMDGAAAGMDAGESLVDWVQCATGDTELSGLDAADRPNVYKATFTPAAGSCLANGLYLAANLLEDGVQQILARDEVAPSPFYAAFMRDRENSWYASETSTMDPTSDGDPDDPQPLNYLTSVTCAALIGADPAGVIGSLLFFHADPNIAALATITNFNPATGEITCTSTNKPNIWDTNPGGSVQFCIVNAIHKISAAGHYAIRPASGGQVTLYYYPNNTANLTNGKITYAARQHCMRLGNANDIEFYGITFRGAGMDNSIVRKAMVDNGINGTYGARLRFVHCSTVNSAGHDNGNGGMTIGGSDILIEHHTTERHLQGQGIALAPGAYIRVGYAYFARTEQTPISSTANNTSVALVYFPEFDLSCAADPHINKTFWYGGNGVGWTHVLIHGAVWPYGFPGYATWKRTVGMWFTGCRLSTGTNGTETRAVVNQSSFQENAVADNDNFFLLCDILGRDGQVSGDNMTIGVDSSGGNKDYVGGCNVHGVGQINAGFAESLGGNNYITNMPAKKATDFKVASIAELSSDVTTQTLTVDGPGYAKTGVDFSARRAKALELFNGCLDGEGNVFIDFDRDGNPIDWSNPTRGAIQRADTYTPATQSASANASAASTTNFSAVITVNNGNGSYEWFVDANSAEPFDLMDTPEENEAAWAARKAAATDESAAPTVIQATGGQSILGNDVLGSGTYSFHWRWTNAFGQVFYGTEADAIVTTSVTNPLNEVRVPAGVYDNVGFQSALSIADGTDLVQAYCVKVPSSNSATVMAHTYTNTHALVEPSRTNNRFEVSAGTFGVNLYSTALPYSLTPGEYIAVMATARLVEGGNAEMEIWINNTKVAEKKDEAWGDPSTGSRLQFPHYLFNTNGAGQGAFQFDFIGGIIAFTATGAYANLAFTDLFEDTGGGVWRPKWTGIQVAGTRAGGAPVNVTGVFEEHGEAADWNALGWFNGSLVDVA